ncbi:hypothetical protein ES708_12865 [subsurface metagenome]
MNIRKGVDVSKIHPEIAMDKADEIWRSLEPKL